MIVRSHSNMANQFALALNEDFVLPPGRRGHKVYNPDQQTESRRISVRGIRQNLWAEFPLLPYNLLDPTLSLKVILTIPYKNFKYYLGWPTK